MYIFRQDIEEVRDVLLGIVEAAAPNLSPQTQASIVDVLLGPEVGATDPSLFKCIELVDIPVSLAGAAPRRAIIKALSEYGGAQ